MDDHVGKCCNFGVVRNEFSVLSSVKATKYKSLADDCEGQRLSGTFNVKDTTRIISELQRYHEFKGMIFKCIGLKSLAGCTRQFFGGFRYHRDYRHAHGGVSRSLSAVIAQMEETALNFLYNGKDYEVVLNPGYAVFFRHSTLHSGAGYEKENCRIFCYIYDKV